jgi:peptide/nickel transport system permease protein
VTFLRLLRNRGAVLGALLAAVFLGVGVVGPVLAPKDPDTHRLDRVFAPPSAEFVLGTDHLGRDVLSRVLYAGRNSFLIGIGAVAVGLGIGAPLGLTTGFFGGLVDNIAMRVVDVMLAFPGILLALAIISALGPGLGNVVLAVGISSIPIYARIVRGTVLRLRTLEFILAAEALGAGPTRIITVHLLRNCLGPIVVQTSLRFAEAIIVGSGLSFLGLGVPPTVPEWGSMLADGRGYLRSAPWVAVFPGLCLMTVVLGFNLVGDGLRDALDPRLRV